MQLNNLNNTNPSFKANLILSGEKLLKNHEVAELETLTSKIGTPDDIVEINFKSGILDWYENNQHGKITKILSGFKMVIESTLANFEKTDCSVAKTQQDFWYGYSEFSPFARAKKWLETAIKGSSSDSEYNIRPEIYNTENCKWENNAKIEIFEAPRKTPAKTFYNSPFYKAICEHKEIGLDKIFQENLANDNHRINLKQLRTDISELKNGKDVMTPVIDFSTGIVHPKSEEIKSSKYVFIEGLQTQFPEIENLADMVIRLEVPAKTRKQTFIQRATQNGVKTEQAEKDLEASNEYMEKLIPLNPNSADIVINGRYAKEDLIQILKSIFA